MKCLLYTPYVILISLLFTGGFFLFHTIYIRTSEDRLQQAFENYQKGENATNVAERQEAFNRALEMYTQLDAHYHPIMGNGKLYYDIANTYFQLNAFPWALLYAYRALDLRPQDERVLHTIKMAREKLSLPLLKENSSFHSLFFFHNQFSLPERLQMFAVFSITAFTFFSLWIWFSYRWLYFFGLILLTFCSVLFLSLIYTCYFSSIEAVIVRSTQLYRDAGTEYATVQDKPLPSGELVEVLDVLKEGKWLKIQTSEGALGYASHDAVKIIKY